MRFSASADSLGRPYFPSCAKNGTSRLDADLGLRGRVAHGGEARPITIAVRRCASTQRKAQRGREQCCRGERALALLGAFDATDRSLTISELTRRADLPLATAGA